MSCWTALHTNSSYILQFRSCVEWGACSAYYQPGSRVCKFTLNKALFNYLSIELLVPTIPKQTAWLTKCFNQTLTWCLVKVVNECQSNWDEKIDTGT